MPNVIDFHSHILPGIDDGSASVSQSIAMLQMEAQQGIKKVVASPHFYAQNDTPECFLERRAQAEEQLRAAMLEYEGLPELEIGAEVYFFRGISESEFLEQLTIKGNRCILVENPMTEWSESIYAEINSIYYDRGIVPIIAHVDRYISRFRTYGIPEKLADMPVLVQANASFFLQPSTRGMALKMLRDGKIHLLGSDCHNLSTRKPNLGDALEIIGRRLGPDIIGQINSYEQYALGESEL